LIARTVVHELPPPAVGLPRAAAQRSPAMCKRKARMRGGGEGGRKCAFGGANFSKDGKAHNLCDAAKGAVRAATSSLAADAARRLEAIRLNHGARLNRFRG
jgi:hypothetical protein